jgi:hypothetical protein
MELHFQSKTDEIINTTENNFRQISNSKLILRHTLYNSRIRSLQTGEYGARGILIYNL